MDELKAALAEIEREIGARYAQNDYETGYIDGLNRAVGVIESHINGASANRQ
jgi:hypothetical protein